VASVNQVILVFDHRDDQGPAYVGPFRNRGDALTHIEELDLRDAVWTAVRLTHPDDDRPARTPA
jgi:hypothetical protein